MIVPLHASLGDRKKKYIYRMVNQEEYSKCMLPSSLSQFLCPLTRDAITGFLYIIQKCFILYLHMFLTAVFIILDLKVGKCILGIHIRQGL